MDKTTELLIHELVNKSLEGTIVQSEMHQLNQLLPVIRRLLRIMYPASDCILPFQKQGLCFENIVSRVLWMAFMCCRHLPNMK